MIVSNHHERFQLFTQYNHSKLSGQFVPYWNDSELHKDTCYPSIKLAIEEHDRAWIPLDQEPLWNDEKGMPHSFMDYPMKPKIEAYARGINEVEDMSAYAGYLNSLHFLSFFNQNSTDPDISRFISREIDRQYKLEEHLLNKQDIDYHYKLLQFCDDLSLYICLNKPGVPKEDEHFMFKDGFRQDFNHLGQKIQAHWKNEHEILVEPFPFNESFQVTVPYRELTKEEVEDQGLIKSYNQAEWKERKVFINRV
ncbi:DUF3891 family protein [Aquisalibacillus elongatus]|uniref:Uncharacterized protein DUF3891 n=1 Tax=Aquisalibacillus elongatus TaxID=485577 RepID=A0A3N5B203_9BACI|nr:DUF3891 family protein [Aquisalibacillus elongatus]RPF51169.1 uncharacterized protein DUF3891 [Aquisalibacillus elongatus]